MAITLEAQMAEGIQFTKLTQLYCPWCGHRQETQATTACKPEAWVAWCEECGQVAIERETDNAKD